MVRVMIPGAVLAVACEVSMDKGGDSADTAWASEDEGSWGGGGGAGGRDTSDDDDWAPEEEDDYLKLEPASTNAYVFVVNTSRDTVTRIGVPNLDVITTGVGDDPIVVATTPDYATAVTFNMTSDDVSIIPSDDLDAVVNVQVRDNYNTMKMSPDGRWVALWHDEDAEEEFPEASSGGTESYSEVSLVNLDAAEHTALAVGFNPREVQFTADATLAVAVSDAWIALVDLTATVPEAEHIQVSEDTIDPPAAEEVVLSPDNRYAFVRQGNVDELVVVDLQNQYAIPIAIGAGPSDLDLTIDGKSAVAVARTANELWVIDAADPFSDPRVIPMPAIGTWGSVIMSPDGERALLYSTTSGESLIASWNLADDSIEVYATVKPIESLGISPDGGTALLFHTKSNGDTDTDSPFFNEWALTLVDLDDFFSNPLLLPAEPTAWAQSADGATGFFVMDGQPYFEVIHYDDLLFDEVELASVPVHIGVLPDTTWAYASQEHELGRISFYDFDDEVLQTITGFELNSGIETE